MCAPVIVTEKNAYDLITGPGNPHLIWDGAETRVITEDFYRALHAESAWLLIMSRADLAALDPGALAYHPAALAELLTTFGDDRAGGPVQGLGDHGGGVGAGVLVQPGGDLAAQFAVAEPARDGGTRGGGGHRGLRGGNGVAGKPG